MTDDLSDLYAELRRLRREVDRLQTATPLQNASVGRGRTRYYNNSELLIEDSNLSVVGTASVTGWLRVIGRILLEGLGILTVHGLIELFGRMRVSGGGGIAVEDGGDIDVIGGMIRAGLIRIEDGKLFDGENMVLDPAEDGGAALFANGSKLYSNATAIGLRKGDSALTVGEKIASLLVDGKAFTVTDERFSLLGVRRIEDPGDIDVYLALTKSNELVAISAAAAGPGAP